MGMIFFWYDESSSAFRYMGVSRVIAYIAAMQFVLHHAM